MLSLSTIAACSFSLTPTVVQHTPVVQHSPVAQRSPTSVRMWFEPDVYRAPNGEFVWDEWSALDAGIDPSYIVDLEANVEDLCVEADVPFPEELIPDECMQVEAYLDLLEDTAVDLECAY